MRGDGGLGGGGSGGRGAGGVGSAPASQAGAMAPPDQVPRHTLVSPKSGSSTGGGLPAAPAAPTAASGEGSILIVMRHNTSASLKSPPPFQRFAASLI